MNSLNFPDANVWLALCWRRHTHTDQAVEWLQNMQHERLFFCRFTQITLLRLLTTEKILGEDTHTMQSAWEMVDRIQADTRISLLPEPNGLEHHFRAHTNLPTRSPKVWADAYLLAFASVAGLKFVTFDKALKSRSTDILVL